MAVCLSLGQLARHRPNLAPLAVQGALSVLVRLCLPLDSASPPGVEAAKCLACVASHPLNARAVVHGLEGGDGVLGVLEVRVPGLYSFSSVSLLFLFL